MDNSLSDSVSPHVPTHDRKGREGKGEGRDKSRWLSLAASAVCSSDLRDGSNNDQGVRG